MSWTYPCTVNNDCLYEGVIRCNAMRNEQDLLEIQRGLASYRDFRARALDAMLNSEQDWYTIAEQEDLFYVKLFDWQRGQELAKKHHEEGLMLELDVTNVIQPLQLEMCRGKPGLGKSTREGIALMPVSLSLYSNLKTIWHVSQEAPARLRTINHRYKNVQLLPLAMYEQARCDTVRCGMARSRPHAPSTGKTPQQ